MKMYRCLYPSCGNLLTESGYCPAHQQWAEKHKVKPFENAKRSNEQFYKTERWKKIRGALVKAHPYCDICGRKSQLQVHHRITPRGDPALFFEVGNLQVVCAVCHRLITKREIEERK